MCTESSGRVDKICTHRECRPKKTAPSAQVKRFGQNRIFRPKIFGPTQFYQISYRNRYQHQRELESLHDICAKHQLVYVARLHSPPCCMCPFFRSPDSLADAPTIGSVTADQRHTQHAAGNKNRTCTSNLEQVVLLKLLEHRPFNLHKLVTQKEREQPIIERIDSNIEGDEFVDQYHCVRNCTKKPGGKPRPRNAKCLHDIKRVTHQYISRKARRTGKAETCSVWDGRATTAGQALTEKTYSPAHLVQSTSKACRQSVQRCDRAFRNKG